MSNQRPEYRSVEVSLNELSPLMLECLAQGQEVLMTVTGNSMSPFLRHKRDQVVLSACDPTALPVGSVPFYRRDNGQYVLHRIVERDDGVVRTRYGARQPMPSVGGELTYTMLGDAQWNEEPDIRPDQVLAVATAFVRMGRRWECDSAAYRRHRLWWHRLLPIRKALIWLDRRLEWRFRRLFPYKER